MATTRIPKESLEDVKAARDAWQLEIAKNNNEHVDDSDEPESPQLEESATDRLARMLSSVEGDDKAVVKLWRVIAPMKYAWCEDYSPLEFESVGFAGIRRKWGKGEYQVRLYSTRNKQTSIRAQQNVTIMEALENDAPIHIPAPAVPAELTQLLALMAQQQQQMAQSQAALLQAVTARPEAPDPTTQMKEMLGLLVLMRQATGADSQPKSNIAEIVAAVRELRSVSEEINPPKDSGDPMMDMLPGVLDLVKTGMAQRQMDSPSSAAVPIVMLPPALADEPHPNQPQPQPQPQPHPEGESMHPMQMQFMILLDMAKRKHPTEKAAAHVYAKAPDEVIEMLAYEHWFDLLARVAPDAVPYREWFEAVGKKVNEMLESEPPIDDEKGAQQS